MRNKKNNKTNNVAFVLDCSGSMSTLKEYVVKGYNLMIDSLKKSSVEQKQKTKVSLIIFSDAAKVCYENIDVEKVKKLDSKDFVCGGFTALYDAIEVAVKTIDDNNVSDDSSYLVITMTDGEENSSFRCNLQKLKKYFADGDEDGRWTFTLQVPVGYKNNIVTRLGLHEHNVVEWENTSEGTKEAFVSTQDGLDKYLMYRSSGLANVKDFYKPVEVNLDKVDKKELHTKLDDISDNFVIYQVDKEEQVKPFIERKTKKDYVIGSAYYQITKPEKIQPNKVILVMEKGKKAIWSGNQAREIIGLPIGEHAKVTLGNLSSFDIFVQSTSVNRILVRGTKVLWNKNHVKNSKPTWDHTKVN